ncbi:hypothetical protein SCP_0801250 [Sparassis crispa]|uniref:Uncharacterized protein n=1 Tax=Sparassis crispa TaxID=139825 RepID=A0A401GTR6_9APHY|nr:hypothetical protein SCP_0801250 [Sparassis crispa]GBE85607.1 hypothetical protein SCP_0801250 [Sparassis crispa]
MSTVTWWTSCLLSSRQYSVLAVIVLCYYDYDVLCILRDVLQCGLFIIYAISIAFRMYATNRRDWRMPLLILALGLVSPATSIYDYMQLKVAIVTLLEPVLPGDEHVDRHYAHCYCGPGVEHPRGFAYANRYLADEVNLKLPVTAFLLRDGTTCYTLLIMLDVIKLALYTTTVFLVVSAFVNVLSSILISRFFLNLRRFFHFDVCHIVCAQLAASRISDIDFVLSTLGDIPAPSGVPELSQHLRVQCLCPPARTLVLVLVFLRAQRCVGVARGAWV